MADHRHQAPHPDSPAVLDIGGDVGALLLITSANRAETEIEVHSLDGSVVTHAAVHPRRTASGLVHAALYPALPEGDYELLLGPRGTPGNPMVSVVGGAVTHVDCP